MAKVEEVDAQVIEPPAQITAVDKLVAKAAEEAEKWPQEFKAYAPKNEDEYKQLKRDFTALNARKQAIVDGRKDILGPYKKVIKDAEGRVKDYLDVADDILSDMRFERQQYEQNVVDNRLEQVEAFYYDFAPDLADVVDFETIENKYAKDKGWYKYGGNVEAIKNDLVSICGEIKKNIDLISSQPYEKEDADRFKRIYFDTLDLSQAAHEAQHEKEKREAMRKLEQERAQREAEQQKAHEEARKQQEQNQQTLADAAPPAPEVETPWVIIIDRAKRSQIENVVRSLRDSSMTGHVMQGDIEHVYKAVKNGRQ